MPADRQVALAALTASFEELRAIVDSLGDDVERASYADGWTIASSCPTSVLEP